MAEHSSEKRAYSTKVIKRKDKPSGKHPHGIGRRIGAVFGILAAGVAAVLGGELLGSVLAPLLLQPLDGLSKAELALASYVVTQGVVVALLIVFAGLFHAGAERLGVGRISKRLYLLLVPLIYLACLLASGLLTSLVAYLVPGFNVEQAQNLGLPDITSQRDVVVMGLLLVGVVPLVEEFIFRGYLFGMLRRELPFWLTTVIVSALFASAHGQWNVALDTFILSLALCFLREKTGSIWASVALHSLKNLVAFLLLYVYNVV